MEAVGVERGGGVFVMSHGRHSVFSVDSSPLCFLMLFVFGLSYHENFNPLKICIMKSL